MLEDRQAGPRYLNGILEACRRRWLDLQGGDHSVFPICYHLHTYLSSLLPCPPDSANQRQHYAKTFTCRMSVNLKQTQKPKQ